MISSLKLAELCGVSQGTVDRALHGRKGISEKTREMILAKAAEHGYIPNPAAREIMTGKTRTVAALIPVLQSPFFMDMMAEIKNRLAADGLRLMISTVNDPEEMLELLQEFAARRYVGAIVIPPAENFQVPDQLAGLKVISLITPSQGKNVTSIIPDEVKTGEVATKFLLDKGHKKIVHVRPFRASPAIRARQEGFEKQLQKKKLKPIIETGTEAKKILSYVKDKGVTAFFCHNDWLALSVIRILESNGISVPGQVSVIGVDNSPTFTSLYPDITTVEYPMHWLAEEVVKTLKKKHAIKPFTSLKIIERKSVGNV